MSRRLKRLMDVVLAGTALVLLSPVMAGVALTVLLTEGRPILYRQRRPGLHGVPFELVKFRTMLPEVVDAKGRPIDADKRMTRVGYLLRKTSLDELPELYNVLRGDMSLVGPRPLLMQYLELYTPEQARRHDVRPGITGWAQVHGREDLPFEERFVLDVWYVDHWSLGLDLKILLQTIRLVPTGAGVGERSEPDRYFEGSRPAGAEAASTAGSPDPSAAAGDDEPAAGTMAS